MHTRYYPLYQVVGWLLLYASLMLSLRSSFGFTSLEYAFGAVLIGTAALWSHLMRLGNKAWLRDTAVIWQLLYFFVGSLLGGAFAGGALFGLLLVFSNTGVIDPIAPGQLHVFFNAVYWGNAVNMWLALMLWSGIYLTLIKARQLRSAGEALASSQLQALEQQLSPHFLFNLINNIRALILEDPQRARESLARLADMLRYSLQPSDGAEVTLAREFEIVSEYIELCKIQFEDRLSFESEVPEHLLEAKIPRMVLQLCVENAIKHGISQRNVGGTIFVRVREIEGMFLQLEVENPAPVLTQRLNKVGTEQSVGLKNIQDRLALLYGPKGKKKGDSLVNVSLTRLPQGDQHDYDWVVTHVTLPLVFLEE